jgi:hypothetical protein
MNEELWTELPIFCPECHIMHSVKVKYNDLIKYMNTPSANVVSSFPYLNKDDCEMIISGICNNCWNWLFSNEDITKAEKKS